MTNRKVQKVVVLVMVGAMLASSVMFGRDAVNQQFGALDLGREVSDAVTQRLERPDRPTEPLTLTDELQGVVERAFGRAQTYRGQDEPFEVEPRHEPPPPVADLTHDRVLQIHVV